MARPLIGGLVAAVLFAVLVVVFGEIEDLGSRSVDATNRIGVLSVAVAAVLAAAVGYRIARRERHVELTAVAPVTVLSLLLAFLGDAGAVTNVAVAIAGPLGAVAGVAIVGRVRA